MAFLTNRLLKAEKDNAIQPRKSITFRIRNGHAVGNSRTEKLVSAPSQPASNNDISEDSVTETIEALDHWKSQEDEATDGLMKLLSKIAKVMTIAATKTQPKEFKPKCDSGTVTYWNRDPVTGRRIQGSDRIFQGAPTLDPGQ